MSLLQRAPRQVYRVYDAEEFMAAQEVVREIPSPPCHGGLSRVLAVAIVLVSVGLVGAMIVTQSSPRPKRSRRRAILDARASLPSRQPRSSHPSHPSHLSRPSRIEARAKSSRPRPVRSPRFPRPSAVSDSTTASRRAPRRVPVAEVSSLPASEVSRAYEFGFER